MPDVIFSDKIGGYIYRMESANIEVDISHCRTSKWNKTTAEMIFKYIHPPVNKSNVLLWRNVDLIDSKFPIIKELNAKHNKVDWNELLEDVCIRTLLRLRQGEPVKKIDTSIGATSPEYLLYPLLVKGQPNVWFGEGGIGKSELAKVASLAIFTQMTNNELGWLVPSESVNTLYLDWEADYESFIWQYKQLCTGLGLPYTRYMDYRRCYHPLADDIEQIQKWVFETNAGLIIIDSILGALGGKESNSTETASEYYNALRQLGSITSLGLGHTSKGEPMNGYKKTVMGSKTFEDRARNVWEVKRAQDQPLGELVLMMKNTKYNFKPQKPVAYRIGFNNDDTTLGTTIMLVDSNSVPEIERMQPTWERIRKELRKQGKVMSQKELAEVLDIKEGTVHAALYQFRQIFVKVGKDWGLKEDMKEEQGELNES